MYTDITFVSPPPTMFTCDQCGSMTYSQVIHDKWHKSVDRTAMEASRAYGMTVPIGGGLR